MTVYKSVYSGVGSQDVIVLSFTGEIDSDGYWQKAHDAYVKANTIQAHKDMSEEDFQRLYRLLESSPLHHNLLAPPFSPDMEDQELAAEFTPDFTEESLRAALQRPGGEDALTSYVKEIVAQRAPHNATATVGFSPSKTLQVTVQVEGIVFGRGSDQRENIRGNLVKDDDGNLKRELIYYFEKGKWTAGASAAPSGEVTGVIQATYRKTRWWQVSSGKTGEQIGQQRVGFTIPTGEKSVVVELERMFPERIPENDNWIDLDLSIEDASVQHDSRECQGGLHIVEKGYTWIDPGFEWLVRPGRLSIQLNHPMSEKELSTDSVD